MAIEVLLGNEAIALGLVEAGCDFASAYPGTPSSEILSGVIKFKKRMGRTIHTEWSTNEKVAFEVALAASWTGLRAAVAMKQVGLNVASDPLYSAAYQGTRGGFIVIPADDPGPHSSQTEQDSRLVALNAKVPVFDPSSPDEARSMVNDGYALSEKYGIPVMLRPTTRLCHALQSIALNDRPPDDGTKLNVGFQKDPTRWAATPKFRYKLHHELNEKLQSIEQEFGTSPRNFVHNEDASGHMGIIASGVAFNNTVQSLLELGVEVPVLKIGTPFPLPRKLVDDFRAGFETVIVIEEPDACIELQLSDRTNVRGRMDGTFPNSGEYTPEIISSVLSGILTNAGEDVNPLPDDQDLEAAIEAAQLPIRRPRLCPGCGHRSTFYAMRKEFGAKAIYPSDIGCYTLGLNMRAVDTLVAMGAAVSVADGLYKAGQLSGDTTPIIATIGDSTFFHSGIAPLINAVHSGSRFVLVILDNHTTAMTGFQPTAASDVLADGESASGRASLSDLVVACGIESVMITDPYDHATLRSALRKAYRHTQSEDGGIAVVIARRPCLLFDPTPIHEAPVPVEVTADCDGCRYCLEAFECPALYLSADGSRVDVDDAICVQCGQCIDGCHKGFIVAKHSAEEN
jgi:indolepyruvate ferredoxin oxidoreductase alpha subunit